MSQLLCFCLRGSEGYSLRQKPSILAQFSSPRVGLLQQMVRLAQATVTTSEPLVAADLLVQAQLFQLAGALAT